MLTVVRAEDARALDLPGRRSTEIASGAMGAASSTVRIVEIDPGPTTRGPHVHDTFEEVIHVLAGHGRVMSDAGEADVGPGDTIVMAPGVRHQTLNTGQEVLRLFCAFPVADIRPGTQEFAGWLDE